MTEETARVRSGVAIILRIGRLVRNLPRAALLFTKSASQNREPAQHARERRRPSELTRTAMLLRHRLVAWRELRALKK